VYTVYFGDDYDTVENATAEDGIVVGVATTYDPGVLELDKVYYWRVDTGGAYGQFKGEVLSFRTTVPTLGKIVQELWFNIPEWSVDLLRNDPRYPHSPDETTEITAFDTGSGLGDEYGGRVHGWLYVPATGDYTFWLTTDDQGELWLSTNDDPGNVERIARESSYRGYNSWGTGEEQSDPIPLVAGNKYYIMALWKEGDQGDHCQVAWQGPGVPELTVISGSNLSPYEPVSAFGSNPGNGAQNISQTPNLSWKPGIEAASHEVYFGTDEDAIKNATTASPEYIGPRALGNESYEPGKLAWASTYYWRIDEVNNLHPDSPWVGSVWSFTTADFAIVDDFEDYNTTDKQIWAIWHDGLGYWDLQGTFHPGNGTGAAVGDEDNDVTYMEETIIRTGSTQSMPYFFNNNDPTKMKYSEAKLTLSAPRDWTDGGAKALSLWFQGTPGSVGSFTDNFDGTYTITASGFDIWDTPDFPGAGEGYYHDEFHFAYKPLAGVGSITARVDSVGDTHTWAKAGVMIRESLDPNSVHAMMVVTSSEGVSFQNRPVTGGASLSTTVTGITAPQWVKLERDISGFFTASYSSDGQNWTQVGLSENIPMGQSTFVGLVVTAHNDGNPVPLTCEAEFSNVQVSVAGPWSNQDIGILSNDAERMYVAIANSNGTTGTVYYEDNDNIDTTATQIDTWTEWLIDLKDFQDQGVNLADVNSVAIGFGTRGSTTPGGAGKVYFEDIRLYRPRYIPGKGTPLAADFNGDGVIDYRDLETMAGDWLMQDDTVTTANPGTANLVAYYPLDEGAGTVAGDSAGGHNGTVVGGAQWIAGPDGFGSALMFDGAGGQYVDLGTWNPSAGTGQLTVCFWANWSGVSGQWMGLIGKRDDWAEDEMMWQIEAAQGDGNVSASRESGQTVSGNFIQQIGQWEHVALTFDGTTATLYRYGLQAGSGPFSLGPDTEATMVFGTGEANGGNPYNGALDEVRIYNRALSQAEIAYLISDGAATLHVPVLSPADLSDDEPEGSKSVNFKDYAVLVDMWLDEQLWPEW
jgi:hypothetical protein